jgi:hypothetical protein
MNSRKERWKKPLDGVLEKEPPDRTADLERRVARLERDVEMLNSLSLWPGFNTAGDDPEKMKPGPKEQIGDLKLFRLREGLIMWLEPYWPWMGERLYAARNPNEIQAILEATALEPDKRQDWQTRLLQNTAALFEFLAHERFGKTIAKTTVTDALTLPWEAERRRRAANQLPTRKIANALAGVPEIGWRRSFDRCSEQPSRMELSVNLDLHYREQFGIPLDPERDLTGTFSPLPKPLNPNIERRHQN